MNSAGHVLAIVVAASLRLGALGWLPWGHIAKWACNLAAVLCASKLNPKR